MFGFVIAIILALVGIIGGVIVAFMEEDKTPGVIFGVVLLVIALIVGICSCVRSVPTGHTGVVTTFGKVGDYTLDAGIHFMKPWNKVVKMDNRVQKKTLDLTCFSSDIQEVNIKYTINYQIDKTNAMNIYKSIGKTYDDMVIDPNVAEAAKEVVALYTAENLVNCREEMSTKVETVLAERLLKYSIEVVNTAVEDMDFTDAFTDAVEAKQVAQQNKLKAETVAEQKVIEAEAAAKVKTVEAQAKAEADKIAAEAEAYQIEVKATAEAEANKKISESLNGTIIDYEYAKNWDGKLPTYMSGDSGMIPVIN